MSSTEHMNDLQIQTVRATPLATTAMPIETLIAQAIEKGTPVDTMERLLAMAREVKAEQAREAFNMSLAAFQSDCPVIAKTHKGHNSHYAKLEDIVAQTQAIRQKHGLHYAFDTKQEPAAITVVCRITHAGGHTETSSATFPIDAKAAGMNDQQKVASAITYAKRYALMNALGIVVADEDNDAAYPNPAPPADATQQKVKPRAERTPAAVTVDDLKALFAQWRARSGQSDRQAFVAWARPIIGAADGADLTKTSVWTREGFDKCTEAML